MIKPLESIVRDEQDKTNENTCLPRVRNYRMNDIHEHITTPTSNLPLSLLLPPPPLLPQPLLMKLLIRAQV